MNQETFFLQLDIQPKPRNQALVRNVNLVRYSGHCDRASEYHCRDGRTFRNDNSVYRTP